MLTISDVFNNTLDSLPIPASESRFETTCPVCNTHQFLNECSKREREGVTVYRCKNGDADVAFVGPTSTNSHLLTGGYRISDYVVNGIAPILFQKSPGSAKIQL